MSKYNVDIVGAGSKGALSDAPGTGNEYKYISYAHAVTVHRGFHLNSFYDRDKAMKTQAEEIWHPEHVCRFPDIIIIATPDDSHYTYLKTIMQNYVLPKLVICEKPLCCDIEQAEEIIHEYSVRGIPLLVDYTRRFITYFQDFKEKPDKGDFLKGYLYFNRGWEHTVSHFVDMVLWFNGHADGLHIEEVKTDYQWVYQWGLFYQNTHISEHYGIKNDGYQISNIFDNHLYDLMQNAYEFLQGKSSLLCTGEDALQSLKETLKIKNKLEVEK